MRKRKQTNRDIVDTPRKKQKVEPFCWCGEVKDDLQMVYCSVGKACRSWAHFECEELDDEEIAQIEREGDENDYTCSHCEEACPQGVHSDECDGSDDDDEEEEGEGDEDEESNEEDDEDVSDSSGSDNESD